MGGVAQKGSHKKPTHCTKTCSIYPRCSVGGQYSRGYHKPTLSSHQNKQHVSYAQCMGQHSKGSPKTLALIAPEQAACIFFFFFFFFLSSGG